MRYPLRGQKLRNGTLPHADSWRSGSGRVPAGESDRCEAMELAISSVWLAIVAWLILRAVRQRGLLPQLAVAPPPSGEQPPHPTVIVPARDEEAIIGRCLQSLAQDYPASRLSVVVVSWKGRIYS